MHSHNHNSYSNPTPSELRHRTQHSLVSSKVGNSISSTRKSKGHVAPDTLTELRNEFEAGDRLSSAMRADMKYFSPYYSALMLRLTAGKFGGLTPADESGSSFSI
jgi:hypothetical protein